MAYRFEHDDETAKRGLRRIACEQIDRALGALDKADERASAIHEVRKCCKRLRGLVRIVRTRFDGYKVEDAFFRDTARLLGGLRDREVLLETFESLGARLGEQGKDAAYLRIRLELSKGKHASSHRLRRDCFDEARDRLAEARDRARQWQLEADDWGVVCGGLVKTYRSARKAMNRAVREPTGENHHEWRKHTEFHWFHARLLRRHWADRMAGRIDRARQLSTLLGDHHDLFVLEQRLAETLASPGSAENGEGLIALARRRRVAIEKEAHRLGARLLAKPPHTWSDCCKAWRRPA